eukprot:gnl/MRDRNA2_/MRDRNA2_71046_c0_seq3.p1 gnl/MRDRNA2_/MRDRNA2_71046_c0~~gnl/MRDRNA2_/MRDRNA2_71046_c0_seq3.p1  ORF type:complete len:332 (+),score=55.81 gnl/MRDRNA2_/MRDRNA2_71046_c0_seq3:198-1193(+)
MRFPLRWDLAKQRIAWGKVGKWFVDKAEVVIDEVQWLPALGGRGFRWMRNPVIEDHPAGSLISSFLSCTTTGPAVPPEPDGLAPVKDEPVDTNSGSTSLSGQLEEPTTSRSTIASASGSNTPEKRKRTSMWDVGAPAHQKHMRIDSSGQNLPRRLLDKAEVVQLMQGFWENVKNIAETYTVTGLEVMRSKPGIGLTKFNMCWDDAQSVLNWGHGRKFCLDDTQSTWEEVVWITVAERKECWRWRRSNRNMSIPQAISQASPQQPPVWIPQQSVSSGMPGTVPSPSWFAQPLPWSGFYSQAPHMAQGMRPVLNYHVLAQPTASSLYHRSAPY